MKIHTQRALLGALVSTAALLPAVSGFTSSVPGVNTRSSTVLYSTPEEDRAALLSGYLAKAHEEKLKAVRAVELAKDAEIAALKEQLAAAQAKLAAGGGVAAPEPVPVAPLAAPVPEPVAAVAAPVPAPAPAAPAKPADQIYKERNAHVTEAAKAGKSRWGSLEVARANFLTNGAGAPPIPAPTTPVAPAPAPATDSFYATRNAHVAEAAKAGKSRWGDMEVDRAQFLANGAGAPAAAPGEGGAVSVSPETIAAADHGLRNDGGVGGLTLAERLAGGANADPAPAAAAAPAPATGPTNEEYAQKFLEEQEPRREFVQQRMEENKLAATVATPAATAAAAPASTGLYEKRSAHVARAAQFGKSRWGDMEVARAKSMQGSAGAVPAETIEAADHGLRNDGGVGGLTLAERIAGGRNAGVQQVPSATAAALGQVQAQEAAVLEPEPAVTATPAPEPAAPAPKTMEQLYAIRNAHLVEADKAGKSRWGSLEVARAAFLTNRAAQAAPVEVQGVPPEVEAADHGLRNDGGVGGLTLAERVANGAGAGQNNFQ